MDIFNLSDEYIELCRLLKIKDFQLSGGMAKNVIADGLVKVNGVVEFRKKCKIRRGDMVEFDGMKIFLK